MNNFIELVLEGARMPLVINKNSIISVEPEQYIDEFDYAWYGYVKVVYIYCGLKLTDRTKIRVPFMTNGIDKDIAKNKCIERIKEQYEKICSALGTDKIEENLEYQFIKN